MPLVQVYHGHLEVFDPGKQIPDGRRIPKFHPVRSSDQIHLRFALLDGSR